ncbi:MAG: hypothetical protein RJA70_2055 [Pseudomonadota bacterium]|jgi:ubiquinone/menaquinone biosynthesis C-methylase UbiE
MSHGRRKVQLEDEAAWVFNRMVDAYEARPAYPQELIDLVAALAENAGARVGDIGAGVGHLALPLALRGLLVTAVEPASLMLQRLRERAAVAAAPLQALQGTAESIPVADGSFDLVVVSDAVHFMDPKRTAYELKRVLTPRGALALVTVEFTSTPFMNALTEVMRSAAPRRPRDVSSALTQLLAVSGVDETAPRVIEDEAPVSEQELAQILRSISFIGPAMNTRRSAAFLEQVYAIPYSARWARTFTLRSGRRKATRCDD